MARFILDIQRELGITMVMVEHDMGLVMDIADRVMVLDFGEQIALGTAGRGAAEPERDRRLPRLRVRVRLWTSGHDRSLRTVTCAGAAADDRRPARPARW